MTSSDTLFDRASRYMPGGNTRHSVFFAPHPVYASTAKGCRVTDVEGRERIDCINNMSALIHGHDYAPVVEAVREQAGRLLGAGMPTETEIELAALICDRVHSVERVRFCTSGSESVMFAIRAARAHTGRNLVAKAEGAYHGSYDTVEFSLTPMPHLAGSAERPNAVPATPGLPAGSHLDTVVLPFNDTDATLAIIDAHRDELAAVLIDPCVSRMGFVMADRAYLEAIRERCTRHGIVLIFDEVFSFRIAYNGGQSVSGVAPDLSVFGKVIGGGLPVGAVGGSARHMAVFDQLHASSLVEHSGTHFASPLSMVAGAAALRGLTPDVIAHLDTIGDRLRAGIEACLRDRGISGHAAGVASLVCVVFDPSPIRNFRDFWRVMSGGGMARGKAFHRAMLEQGAHIVPGGGLILSSVMSEADIDELLLMIGRSLDSMKEQ